MKFICVLKGYIPKKRKSKKQFFNKLPPLGVEEYNKQIMKND